MITKDRSLTIRISEEERDAFSQFCQSRGLNQSTLIREMIRRYMAAKRHTEGPVVEQPETESFL